MDLTLIRGLYDYHRWANRRLFEVVAGPGEETAARGLGSQWSVPSLKGMLAHIYGADWIWLERWKGQSPTAIPGAADFATLGDLRRTWDGFEVEQRRFIEGLVPEDLGRPLAYRGTDDRAWTTPLWQLLQHVANHATHHRSEVATMITVVAGSPPPTDLIVWQRITSGQQHA